MKRLVVLIIGLMLLLSASYLAAEDVATTEQADSVKSTAVDSARADSGDQFIVYYLHMNRRCMTCEKLEAYSKEAVTSAFAEQLADSSVEMRVVNFEEEGNEHFAKDYQLFSQALVVSRVRDGKEIAWRNLDKIWTLVNNKEKFIGYVQSQIKNFMNPFE